MGDETKGTHFSAKYQQLCNQVNGYKFKGIASYIEDYKSALGQRCLNGSCYISHTVLVEDVLSAVNRLQSGKCDGDVSHTTEHVNNGTQKLLRTYIYVV